MNIHEVIDYLMEKEGNQASVFFGAEYSGLRVFSGRPMGGALSIWVQHESDNHPVLFAITSHILRATFFKVVGSAPWII